MSTFRCNVCEAFNTAGPHARGARCSACESRLDLVGTPQEVDAAALARAIALSPVPLFVDFFAPWCVPCVMAAPMVHALSARMAGEIVVLTVDTQRAEEAAETHAIYAIPTFAVFRRGEEIARQMGLLPEAGMERWVRKVLAPPAADLRA